MISEWQFPKMTPYYGITQKNNENQKETLKNNKDLIMISERRTQRCHSVMKLLTN